ncbi:MAG TPA: ATP-binding protein [Casimicrobiaceae bacterium]
MKFGITSKLFVAILATNAVVAVAFVVALQLGVNARFRDYVRDREAHRLEMLSATLAEAYDQHGNWAFLRDNGTLWNMYTAANRPLGGSTRRAAEAPPRAAVDPPPVRPGFMLPQPRERPPGQRRVDAAPAAPTMVVDAQQRRVVGANVERANALRVPIVANAGTVGWLLGEEPRLAAPDLRFLREQSAVTWTIAGLAILLAALAAMALARGLLAPVRRLARATHRLAAGDYGERVVYRSRDELGQLVQDFNALAHTLERTEQTRREFLADVSHELRTPVAVLQAELEALHDGVRLLTPAAIESLRAEAATLGTLIDDLQQLASADVGSLAYAIRTLDLAALTDTALNAFADRLAERRLAVETKGLDAAVMVDGDPQRLTQLLNNLLENTLRYTDPGGRVRVALARWGAFAQLDVEDSAPGVPPEALPRIFERLYRVDRSRNRARGGAGLGLAVCRSIAAAHGGEISADASPLGGLCIRLRLPLAET